MTQMKNIEEKAHQNELILPHAGENQSEQGAIVPSGSS
jgi:hypothetical protein